MTEDRTTVFVLSAVVFLVLLGITTITPALPLYAQTLGATEFLVSIAVGAAFMARVLFDIPAGVLGDRRGQKAIMTAGLAAIAVSSTVAGLAFNFWVLVAVRFTEGVGSAMYVTCSTALLVKAAPDAKRGEYMSYYVSALLVGAVLGPAVGGYLAAVFGLSSPFFFYALIAAIAIALLQVFLRGVEEAPAPAASEPRGSPAGEAPGLEEIGRLLRDPSFLLVNLAVLSAFFVRGGFNLTIFPLWGQMKFGLGPDFIGLLLTLAAVAALVTLLPAGRIADKYGRKAPFMSSLLLTAVVLPFVFLSNDLVTLAVTITLYGLAIGFHGPLAAWPADLVPKESLGTAMGVYRTIGDLGWVLGPLVMGYVGETMGPLASNPWPFLVASAWLVVFGLLLIPARDPVGEARVELPVMGDGGR